jgi:hypothetical protein
MPSSPIEPPFISRAEAEGVRETHDPKRQGHGYNRCEHCHYTSHPCDAYDMADAVVRLLDREAARG